MNKILSAAIAALSFLPLAANAATFDFTGYSDGAQETLTQTVDGLSVSVTAGVYSLGNPGFFVPDYDGFPVIGLGDLAVSTQDGKGPFSGAAGIGVAPANASGLLPDINSVFEMLTFTFDSIVDFGSIRFGNVSSWFAEGFDLFVDGVLVNPSDRQINGNQPYDLTGLQGTSISFGASGLFDSFNIQSISATQVAPVPLPAGLVLMLTGIAGFGGIRRMRKA
ncbi:VPLPA-CTERM sorting domain-containing protein [Sulfitobacter sp. LCG007]